MTPVSAHKHRLIPPPDEAPPSVKHLSLEKRLELWAELVDENDALVQAGLRANIGPHGDFEAAYRDWYSRHMEEHERGLIAFANNFTNRGAAHG